MVVSVMNDERIAPDAFQRCLREAREALEAEQEPEPVNAVKPAPEVDPETVRLNLEHAREERRRALRRIPPFGGEAS